MERTPSATWKGTSLEGFAQTDKQFLLRCASLHVLMAFVFCHRAVASRLHRRWLRLVSCRKEFGIKRRPLRMDWARVSAYLKCNDSTEGVQVREHPEARTRAWLLAPAAHGVDLSSSMCPAQRRSDSTPARWHLIIMLHDCSSSVPPHRATATSSGGCRSGARQTPI